VGVDTTLGRANVAVRATLEQLDGDLSDARGKVDSAISRIVGGAGKSFQALGSAALGGIGVATGAVTGLGAALGKITMDAAPVEGVSKAFSGLAESAGRGTDDMLAALKRGSAGMVANRDLMMTFNEAAQLVSTDFAVQLPDAMQYLGKVSAATGSDMGFMLDSLVKGVGRLSPMILDNLGIQVAQSEATERAAEMFGVEASELDKAQVQAGMMNVVLEKLAANTASMPDVTESAAAKMARFKATVQDTKDQVGLALLPVLNNLMGTFGHIAESVLPLLTGFIESTLAPALETATLFIDEFVAGILAGNDPLTALQATLKEFGLAEVAELIGTVTAKVQELWTVVQPWLEQAAEWVARNVELQDVLIVLGAAIASVVLPALWSLVAAAAPVIAVFVAGVAIVAALRQAWETDWMGIRTALTDAWENSIRPALETLWAWLQVNVPAAIETLRTFWETTLLPAIQTVMAFITGTAIPTFNRIADVATTVVGAAVTALATLWKNTLKPALETVWAFIQNNIMPLFEALANLTSAVVGAQVSALAGIFQNVLMPAMSAVWAFIREKIIPIFTDASDAARDTLGPALDWLSGLLGPLEDAFKGIKSAIKSVVDWINRLADRIRNLDVPDWMRPGSPTPLELGLRGIAGAMSQLARVQIPQFSAELQQTYDVEGGTAGGGGNQQIVIYGLTLQGVQDVGGLLGELQALAA